MDKKKLRKLMAEEGQFRIYNEQHLIKPISNLLEREKYTLPLYGNNSSVDDIISKGIIEDYFLDFLGIKDEGGCVPKVLNYKTGKLHKDYTQPPKGNFLAVPYRKARPVFLGNDDEESGHKIFDGSPESDFIYAVGDLAGNYSEDNLKVTPMEFFSKYIHTDEERNNSEFMFVKYATELNSIYSLADPTKYRTPEYIKPSLESNVHYSRIKYFENDGDFFVYVENRKLSIIKKRYFTNLTVNKEYYNNLLLSLGYVYPEPRPSFSPLRIVIDKLYDGKFWGKEYEPAFNSIKISEYNHDVFSDIKQFDDEDYIVFDDLDFSYNKAGDVSHSFAITSEGTYTIKRSRDKKMSMISPRGDLEGLDNRDNLVHSIGIATMPSFKSYKSEHGLEYSKRMYRLQSWEMSSSRREPISFLFGALSNSDRLKSSDLARIKQSSIYPVLLNIYAEKIKASETIYKKPKNSSKLALNSKKDKVQILADYLASGHSSIYSDFKRNSYKVTLKKLRQAFEYVPPALRGTINDHKDGKAISLGDGMYIKLLNYMPDKYLYPPRSWGYGRTRSTVGSGILGMNKMRNRMTKINATLGWLLSMWYALYEEREGESKPRNITSDMREYLGEISASAWSSDVGTYAVSNKPAPVIPFVYGEKKGKYAINYGAFESLRINDELKNLRSIESVITAGDRASANCEPLLEPTQYKIVAKDSEGNIAYSIIRPFIGVDFDSAKRNSPITLIPSIPMHNFVFYVPKSNPDREVFSVHLYDNGTGEFIEYTDSFQDPISTYPGDNQSMYPNNNGYSSEFKRIVGKNEYNAQLSTKNPLAYTLKDTLAGGLSTERHPYMNLCEYSYCPSISSVWSSVFEDSPSKFFEDYKTPSILFGEVGRKYGKLKGGDSIKKYFRGTSMEILRIDAWLGLRPTDRANLNLYNPDHWVNQRAFLDLEFQNYMRAVLLCGAYHLTTMVEAGMDTREINFETYDDRLFRDVFAPHRRGPYAISILSGDSYYSRTTSPLSYFSGCFATRNLLNQTSKSGHEIFADTSLDFASANFKGSTVVALSKIRDGKISTYADFVIESLSPSLIEKTKKERKLIRNRLSKFLLSEDYIKSVLLTTSQLMIENIVFYDDVRADMLSPIDDLTHEINLVGTAYDLGRTDTIDVFRRILLLRLYTIHGYSIYDIFRYVKSLVTEQKASKTINGAFSLYKSYLDNVEAISNYGDVTLEDKKTAFPEAFMTQVYIAQHNRGLIRDQEAIERFQRGSSQYKVMEYRNSNYIIRMAQTPLELQLEGNNLGHCVGTYEQKMVRGTNIIFFLRNRKKPDDSNITVEFIPYSGTLSNVSIDGSYSEVDFNNGNLEFVMRGHINQVQGSSRRPVNMQEALFLNEWRSFVQDQMRKKITLIPSFNKKKKVKIRHEFIFGSTIQSQIDKHLKEEKEK